MLSHLIYAFSGVLWHWFGMGMQLLWWTKYHVPATKPTPHYKNSNQILSLRWHKIFFYCCITMLVDILPCPGTYVDCFVKFRLALIFLLHFVQSQCKLLNHLGPKSLNKYWELCFPGLCHRLVEISSMLFVQFVLLFVFSSNDFCNICNHGLWSIYCTF